ncbi:DUF29 domain-containing protein [Chroococcidiopsis sp. CCMEE 29]|uniref:DUF29 domain-containing protein n=1 Tax=Chroococcidiopsis sp. CCMEE 29 TaxID=155894 RepID=UPI0020202866|nr:DUF29 domain-containing protein [Chroococcidiopsis sp. CCMEE 29]
MNSTLFDQDYYLWLKETAQILQQGRWSDLDIANLVEEIEDMGRSEKRAVERNLEVVLLHLLKHKYQPEKRSNSWLATLFEHRRRLNKYLKESPSLKPYFHSAFADCYNAARKLAAIETGLEIDIFPTESPFTPEEVLETS